MGVVIHGNDWDIVNLDITGSYTEATYTKPVKNFIINIRGDSSIRIKRLSADTKYFTIKNGGNMPVDLPISNAGADACSLGFYATDGGASDTIEFIVIF